MAKSQQYDNGNKIGTNTTLGPVFPPAPLKRREGDEFDWKKKRKHKKPERAERVLVYVCVCVCGERKLAMVP